MLTLLALTPVSTVRAADITVDDGCLLADAIDAANTDLPQGGCPAGDGEDVITLIGDIAVAGMLPPITSHISILGNGHTLSGAKRDRLLHVASGELSIHDLTLTGGKRELDAGGAIRVERGARLIIHNCVIRDNMAKNGGAIFSRGELDIHNTIFSNNAATTDGGAIDNAGGALDIKESKFIRNSARYGGAVHDSDGFIAIHKSVFSRNTAESAGGGISTYRGAVTISESAFGKNSASRGGSIESSHAIVVIKASDFRGNSAGTAGAMIFESGSANIRDSNIRGNRAQFEGGGILSRADQLNLFRLSVSDNEAGRGGGLYTDDGDVSIAASSFDQNNAASDGGAIWSEGADLEASNSTFYGNRAQNEGGGLYVGNYSILIHLSIVNNWALKGGGIAKGTGIVHLRNSLLASNGLSDCRGDLGEHANVNNFIADGSCDPMLRGDPLLLGEWGSPATFVIAPQSPALDAGDPLYCTDADQTGWERPRGDGCDLGAFEVDPQRTVSFGVEQDPAAGIVVNETCSLVDAIVAANKDWTIEGCPAGHRGADTITLTHDIKLSDMLPSITSDITIEGAGHTISGANKFTIFHVYPGPLTLNDLTLTEGKSSGGGAIYSLDGTIILNRSKVIGNHVTGEILADGGGIYCFPCTLIINDSLIANNSTEQHGGGIAIHALGDDNYLEIRNSVIDGNRAKSGGGLYLGGRGTVKKTIVVNSTISNNMAARNGGGVDASFGTENRPLSIEASTIYGNRAKFGGGVFTTGFTRLTHVTVTGNEAESGGGIYTSDEGRTHMRFSIISNNSGNDCVGYPDQNILSLIADETCSPPLSGDPELAELVQPEDGAPPYFPLTPESPAIDGALDAYCEGQDQTGTPRPQGALCDLGAIEFVQDLADEE